MLYTGFYKKCTDILLIAMQVLAVLIYASTRTDFSSLHLNHVSKLQFFLCFSQIRFSL